MPEIKFLSAMTQVVKHEGQRFRPNLQTLGDGLEAGAGSRTVWA